MNYFLKLMCCAMLLFLSKNLLAQTCVPYSIPLAGVPCDRGYTGTKFPMRTKVCPSGQVTTGATFNTDNCKPVGAPIFDPNQTNCAISPQLIECTKAPTLKGCDAGWHWSLAGSGISHCVPDDPACPWGKSLVHDPLGFPGCVQNTCPANQVLQADGISCACAGGLIWNGASCVAACVPSTVQETSGCIAPLVGSRVRDVTTDCAGNVTRSAWDNSGCVAAAPGCPAPSSIPQACPVSQTGTSYLNTSYGAAPGCLPVVSTDNSGCAPAGFCPVDSSIPQACSGGKFGTAYLITKYGSAPACSPSTTIDETSCIKIISPVPCADIPYCDDAPAFGNGHHFRWGTYVGTLAGPTCSYPPISKVEAGNRPVSDALYNDPAWQISGSANFLNSKGCNIPTPPLLECSNLIGNVPVGGFSTACEINQPGYGGTLREDDLYQCTQVGASVFWKFIKAGKAQYTPGCP